MCDIISSALNSITPEIIGKSWQMTMLSLATDGSEDDLRGSKNLTNAIVAAKESLILSETNEIEFFSNMVQEHGKIEKEVEAGDIFIPEQEEKATISHPKKQKPASPFECRFCGKKYASKYYKMAIDHNQECPAKALTKSKWKPNTKLSLIEYGFMFRFKSVPNVTEIDSD